MRSFSQHLLVEGRVDFLKAKYLPALIQRGMARPEDADALWQKYIDFDPTPNKKFLEWICVQTLKYAKPRHVTEANTFGKLAAALAISGGLIAPAHAVMPPKKYDHPYAGKMLAVDSDGVVQADKNGKAYYIKVPMQKKPVPYTDDQAAFRACDAAHMAHYGTHYGKSKSSLGIAGPTYGCTMYDPDTKWLMVIYTFDTPAIAAKRLAGGMSKQQYDQCMAYNSFVHERGHVNAYAAGDLFSDHKGWTKKTSCTYDKPAPPVPSS